VIWYKFYLGDYITHTNHLSDAEDLAYRRLLDLYYISEKPIPLETESVARKIRLDLDITESVLGEFFDKGVDGYRNNRCDMEIAKYQHQVENNRQLGKRGGRPKKTESITETKPKVNPNQIQKQKEKDINTLSSVAPTTSQFEEFWNNWPASKRKVGKTACKAKWERQALDPLAKKINAVVTRLKASEQWISGFEPAPLTFINQKRWEDDSGTDSVLSRRVI
jgi:uncharacterized protein YdaU (DUF1376 family)